MIYRERSNSELLEIMKKAWIAKSGWLEKFSFGKQKRPDSNIEEQRVYCEAFAQICEKLERSVEIENRKQQQPSQSLATARPALPAHKDDHMQDQNRGYRMGGQAR